MTGWRAGPRQIGLLRETRELHFLSTFIKLHVELSVN